MLPRHGSILPAADTDLIYALIVNETGLFGGTALICIYGLIAARGFRTATIAPDGFSRLLAAGLTAVFTLQAFVIIGGVTRVIPLTGVTLPFVSYGGSSVVANMVLLALLLLISDKAGRAQAGAARDDDADPAPPRPADDPARDFDRVHVILGSDRRRRISRRARPITARRLRSSGFRAATSSAPTVS